MMDSYVTVFIAFYLLLKQIYEPAMSLLIITTFMQSTKISTSMQSPVDCWLLNQNHSPLWITLAWTSIAIMEYQIEVINWTNECIVLNYCQCWLACKKETVKCFVGTAFFTAPHATKIINSLDQILSVT